MMLSGMTSVLPGGEDNLCGLFGQGFHCVPRFATHILPN